MDDELRVAICSGHAALYRTLRNLRVAGQDGALAAAKRDDEGQTGCRRRKIDRSSYSGWRS